MSNYIDGFVFPVPRIYLEEYKNSAEKIAEIWNEYGALAYYEFVGDDLFLEGTKSFATTLEVNKNEVVIFGWVVFISKEIRNLANKKVPLDPRIVDLVAPLTQAERLIFDASRMMYGGFNAFIKSEND